MPLPGFATLDAGYAWADGGGASVAWASSYRTLPRTEFGNAFVCAATAQSDIPGDSFFAQVHDRLGSTAISCRDTDGFGDVMALSSAA
jgi:hypothetical protein